MLRWFSAYVQRNQQRLISGVEASWLETPLRVVLIFLIFVLLGQYIPLWMTLLTATLCFLDDAALYAIRRLLQRGVVLPSLYALAVFNFVGSLSLAIFLSYVRVFAEGYVGRMAAMVILATVLVELASPKARSHPFALVTLLPMWAAMFGGTLIELLGAHTSAIEFATGILILTTAAVYTVQIFMENARNIRELETETERANAANAQKGRFLATMSHEIRTPLHAVYGTAQLLQTARDDCEIRRLGQILMTAASDLKVIVDDVIDFDRVSAGRTEIKPEAVDLSAFTRRMGDLFHANAAAKGLGLAIEIAPEIEGKGAMIDPVRVGQILSNLLSNAIKFTQTGGVWLRLMSDADRGTLCFQVADTGFGVPPEARERIFRAHEKFDRNDRPSQAGAGLGLAISLLLAQRMNGAIDVTDAPEGGARFTLTLPLRAAAPPVPEPAAGPPADDRAPIRPGPRSGPLAGKRILVVDDVLINREVLRAMLERHGASVDEAADGSAGLELVRSRPFDVVLLDNAMPVMSGHEMLVALRNLPGPESALTVIGISAGTIREECDAFIALGLDGFLSKPVSIPDLITLIEDRERSGPSQARPPVVCDCDRYDAPRDPRGDAGTNKTGPDKI